MGSYFDYYRIFQCVSKHRNITAAANELFLSQSTVSRSIQKLEHELGCQLLIRTKQGVKLTPEGELLCHHVSIACEHFEIAEERLHQLSNFGEGSLHIGATEMTMQYFLLPFLEHFKNDFPQIHIKLSFGYPETLLENLNSGLLDLAILTTPLDLDETVEFTPLMEYQDILIAGEKYRYLTEKRQHLPDLKKQPFILMETGTSARVYIDRICRSCGADIQSEYDVSSMPMIVPMVVRNLGIGFIPTFYVQRELAQREVWEIHLHEPLPKRQMCLITSRVYPGSAACREFIKRLL